MFPDWLSMRHVHFSQRQPYMRKATQNDLDFIAESILKSSIVRDQEIFENPSPDQSATSENKIRSYAQHFIQDDAALALIIEQDEKPVACLLSEISDSTLPCSSPEKVGVFSSCWVEEGQNTLQHASSLIEEAEKWFRNHGVAFASLSYFVKNQIKRDIWKHLGYEPFRVFAHKKLA